MGDRGDARGANYVDPHVIRAGLLARRRAVAGVHAHPYTHDGTVRERRLRQRSLALRRGVERVLRGREDHEQGVALDADLMPLREGRPERDGMDLEDLVVLVGPERVHELRRALDVREHEGQRAAWERTGR